MKLMSLLLLLLHGYSHLIYDQLLWGLARQRAMSMQLRLYSLALSRSSSLDSPRFKSPALPPVTKVSSAAVPAAWWTTLLITTMLITAKHTIHDFIFFFADLFVFFSCAITNCTYWLLEIGIGLWIQTHTHISIYIGFEKVGFVDESKSFYLSRMLAICGFRLISCGCNLFQILWTCIFGKTWFFLY